MVNLVGTEAIRTQVQPRENMVNQEGTEAIRTQIQPSEDMVNQVGNPSPAQIRYG